MFDGDDKVAEYLISSARAGVDLGATLGTFGSMRAGAQWTQVHARVDTGDPVLPSVKELTAGGRFGFVVDQFDHAWFPRSGYAAELTFYGATKALGSAVNYQRLSASGTFVEVVGPAYAQRPCRRRHRLRLRHAGLRDRSRSAGRCGCPASGWGSSRAASTRSRRAMYYRRVLPLPDLLGSGVYAGASAEVGHISDRVDALPTPGTLYSGSLFLGADTFAGPAYLGVGVGTGGAFSAYLLLGAP